MAFSRSRIVQVVVVAGLGLSAALLLRPLATTNGESGRHRGAAPGLSRIAELVRRGERDAAIQAMSALSSDTRNTAAAHYLKARLLEKSRRFEEAVTEYGRVSRVDVPPEISSDVSERRIQLLFTLKRCTDALAWLGEYPSKTNRTRLSRAQCLLDMGQGARAIDDLEALSRGTSKDAFTARKLLGDVYLRQGRYDVAVRRYRELLVDRPDHPEVAGVSAHLKRLGGFSSFTLEERLRRANRLVEVHRYSDAVAELKDAAPPRDSQSRAKLFHELGMALFKTRHDYPEAVVVLQRAARLRGPTEVDDWFHAARALSRVDENQKAVSAYRALARKFRDHPRALEAEYLAAWLELRDGVRGARTAMERVLARSQKANAATWMRDASWALSWDALENDSFQDAVKSLVRYLDTDVDSMARIQGLYWLGRAYAAEGEAEKAKDAFREALTREPLHFYALLARNALSELGENPTDPFGAPESGASGSIAQDAGVRGPGPNREVRLPDDVAFYAELGLHEDAVQSLRKKEESVRQSAPSGQGLQAIVEAYRRLGEARRPFQLVLAERRDDLRRRPNERTRWAWDVAYPRPYRDAISQAETTNQLPQDYLYAIMRQESGYDPRAVSYADALGLLQLMPGTAKRLLQGEPTAFSRELLFDPAWNIHLSGKYNGDLHRIFQGQVPLAVAAYNAGEQRVQRWLRELSCCDEPRRTTGAALRGRTKRLVNPRRDRRCSGPREPAPETGNACRVELDRFVENIPIEQTRNYVRRVVTHWARYRYLADPARGFPMALPKYLSVTLGTNLDRAQQTNGISDDGT